VASPGRNQGGPYEAAALATNALLSWEPRDLADTLQTALVSRAIIDHARGVLMGRQRIDADAAFDLLRSASQRENVKVRDIAQRIVDRAPTPSRTDDSSSGRPRAERVHE